MKKRLLCMFVMLVSCYGCAQMSYNSFMEKENRKEQARLEALAEERRQKEQKRQENEASLARFSDTLSNFGLQKGESAVFRKCLNTNGCDSYSLLTPTGFTSSDMEKLDITYKHDPVSYKDIENLEVRVVRKGAIEKLPNVRTFLVLEDGRLISSRCNSWTTNFDGVVQGGVERCQYITLSEIEELKKMIGKTMWVPAPVRIGDVRLSPAHTLKVVDISTDIKVSYSEDYNYIVTVDGNDTLNIPIRIETVSKNPIKQGWSKQVINAIKNGEVYIGMTSEQALLSWGKPNQINKTIMNNLVQEQWVYRKGNFRNNYLYFYNNKLETMQLSQ